MKLLAFDTSTDACSVALAIDDEVLLDHRVEPQRQSRLLLPMIDAIMAKAGIRPTDLDGLVYGQGPGSFTGVRIAIAAAQGIAFGADIGVFGVSTLHSIAQGCHREFNDLNIEVAVDARMSEVYFARYALARQESGVSAVSLLGEEQIGSPDTYLSTDLEDNVDIVLSDASSSAEACHDKVIALAGSGYDLYMGDTPPSDSSRVYRPNRLPSAQDSLYLGCCSYRSGLFVPADKAVPVYLRNQVARTEAERGVGP